MLRAFEACNLVHFKNRYRIPETVFNQTKNGQAPVLFIGENNTGKSAACELIRRCCPDTVTKSQSTIYDKRKIAYSVCKFTINRSLTDAPEYIKPIIDCEITDVISFYVLDQTDIAHEGEDEEWHGTFRGEIYKLMLMKTNEKTIVISRHFHGSSSDEYTRYRYTIYDNEQNEQSLQALLGGLFNHSEYGIAGILIEFIETITRPEKSSERAKNSRTIPLDKRDFDFIYNQLLSNSVVFLFGHRGIGNLDSSLSVHMRLDQINYEAANEKAETFQELYRRSVKRGNADCGSVAHFNKTLKKLVGHSEYEFTINDKKEIIFHPAKNLPGIPLLKTPEGVYEAGLISLLINDPDIETLLLEEPNRCMNRSMNERILLILSEMCETKSIIVVTHSPDFLKWSTRQKVFLFRRGMEDRRMLFKVKHIFENEDISGIRGLSFENWKTIYFSRRVLLVEGHTDERFIRSLLRYHCKRKESEDIAYELSAISLLSVCSCTRIASAVAMCKRAEIPYRAIIDADILCDSQTWAKMPERLLSKLKECNIKHGEEICESLLKFDINSAIKKFDEDPSGDIHSYLEVQLQKYVDKRCKNYSSEISEFFKRHKSEVFNGIKEWDPALLSQRKGGETTEAGPSAKKKKVPTATLR